MVLYGQVREDTGCAAAELKHLCVCGHGVGATSIRTEYIPTAGSYVFQNESWLFKNMT